MIAQEYIDQLEAELRFAKDGSINEEYLGKCNEVEQYYLSQIDEDPMASLPQVKLIAHQMFFASKLNACYLREEALEKLELTQDRCQILIALNPSDPERLICSGQVYHLQASIAQSAEQYERSEQFFMQASEQLSSISPRTNNISLLLADILYKRTINLKSTRFLYEVKDDIFSYLDSAKALAVKDAEKYAFYTFEAGKFFLECGFYGDAAEQFTNRRLQECPEYFEEAKQEVRNMMARNLVQHPPLIQKCESFLKASPQVQTQAVVTAKVNEVKEQGVSKSHVHVQEIEDQNVPVQEALRGLLIEDMKFQECVSLCASLELNYRKKLEVSPRHLKTRLSLIRNNIDLFRALANLARHDEAGDVIKSCISDCQSVLTDNPGNAEVIKVLGLAYIALAASYSHTQEHATIIATYDKAIEHLNGVKILDETRYIRKFIAKLYFNKGWTQYEAKDFDGASISFSRSIEIYKTVIADITSRQRLDYDVVKKTLDQAIRVLYNILCDGGLSSQAIEVISDPVAQLLPGLPVYNIVILSAIAAPQKFTPEMRNKLCDYLRTLRCLEFYNDNIKMNKQEAGDIDALDEVLSKPNKIAQLVFKTEMDNNTYVHFMRKASQWKRVICILYMQGDEVVSPASPKFGIFDIYNESKAYSRNSDFKLSKHVEGFIQEYKDIAELDQYKHIGLAPLYRAICASDQLNVLSKSAYSSAKVASIAKELIVDFLCNKILKLAITAEPKIIVSADTFKHVLDFLDIKDELRLAVICR